MRVFVTGSTGFIGTALVQDLIAAGHQVRGLTRSDAGVEQLNAAGAEALRGDMTDLDCLRLRKQLFDIEEPRLEFLIGNRPQFESIALFNDFLGLRCILPKSG